MPYIPRKNRTETTRVAPQTVGELDYAIMMLCYEHLREREADHGFAAHNEVAGALGTVLLELHTGIKNVDRSKPVR